MPKLHTLVFIVSTLVLMGCQTTPAVLVSTDRYLHDELFPNHTNTQIESEQDVFAVSDEMKAFIESSIKKNVTYESQVKALAHNIFEHSSLALIYENEANTIASETFANKTANCLSLTIMTYALADYAGYGAEFQQVDGPELWVRREQTSLLNRHVNLKLFEKLRYSENIVYQFRSTVYEVDFNQELPSSYYPKKNITKNTVLAMFYNNKGVDALINNDFNQAYAYFKQAIITDDQLLDAYTNLGLLYRRMGRLDWAEQNYLLALKISPDDGSALENLAVLYRRTEREHAADKILRELEIKRKSNPFYHYHLGIEDLEKSQLTQARKHFRNAIKLHRKNHEFYFAMARTLYLMGDKKTSQRYMKLAKKFSNSETERLKYQYKLDAYSSVQE